MRFGLLVGSGVMPVNGYTHFGGKSSKAIFYPDVGGIRSLQNFSNHIEKKQGVIKIS
jgi:hypothetical protein